MTRVFLVVSLVCVMMARARPREAEEVQRLLRAVVATCVERGGWITHFELRRRPGSGLGVVASRAMAAGEAVAELPYALHLNQETVARFLSPAVLAAAVDPQVRVAVFLALERFGLLPRGRPPRPRSWLAWFLGSPPELVSEWAALAELMPDRVENAAHWEAGREEREAAALLRGPLGFIHDVGATWAALEGAGTGLTRAKFVWGYSMLLSRSFRDILGRAVIFPVVDLFNHAARPNVRAAVEQALFPDATDAVTFVLTRDVAAGEELTISYGERRGGGELLQMYGFALPGNPHDAAPLRLADSGIVPRWQTDLLSAARVSDLLYVSREAVQPCALAAFLNGGDAPLSSSSFAPVVLDSSSTCSLQSFPIVAQLCREALTAERGRAVSHMLLPLRRERLAILRRCAKS